MDDMTRRRARELTRDQVEKANRNAEPEEIWDLAAWVGNRWYPVKQPVTNALGITRREINSRQAWRILRRLGIPVHDKNANGPLPAVPGGRSGTPANSRRLALRLAAQVNRGKAVSAESVIAMAEAFEAYLAAA